MRLEWLPLALYDFDEIIDYIAAYRVKKETIQILRVFHSARLWTKRF